jgi:hypothetical protein
LSAAAPAGVPLSLSERVRQAPTPSWLRGFMRGVWGLAGVLFAVGALMLYGAYGAIKTVGLDTAPSIIYAQQISAALADLDANAGNYLLGTRQNQLDATKTFEAQRVVVTTQLIEAAKNITYESERAPIGKLFDGLGRYLELFAEMRYRKDLGDAAGALGVYLNATDLMHQQMLPAADALDKVNFDAMESRYEEQQSRSEGAEATVGLLAAALLGALIWAQVFLFRKTRRVLNLPLVVATVVSLALGGYLVSTIAAARADLKVAKKDAFDSIHALWQAASVAYDANGDETRYVLGGTRAPSFEQAYRDKVKKLTAIPQPDASLSALFKHNFTAGQVPASYTGYFADEMRNITFPGERAAAAKMVEAFAEYDKIDGKIRATERAGRHADAVELCIGGGDRQSNAVFGRFFAALKEVADLNRREFDARVSEGMRALEVAGLVLPVAALLISFLALFGIRRRLREYAA